MSDMIAAYAIREGEWEYLGSQTVGDVEEYAKRNGCYAVMAADGRVYDPVNGWRGSTLETPPAEDTPVSPDVPPAIPGFTDDQMRYLRGFCKAIDDYFNNYDTKRLTDRIGALESRDALAVRVRELESEIEGLTAERDHYRASLQNQTDKLKAIEKAYQTTFEELRKSVAREDKLREFLSKTVTEGVHA